jgi:hypothetical protein
MLKVIVVVLSYTHTVSYQAGAKVRDVLNPEVIEGLENGKLYIVSYGEPIGLDSPVTNVGLVIQLR